MLQFSKDFFKSEIRMGFEIDSEMKHAWAMEMEVLAEIDRICTKYDIMYFAYGGTLLGTVRHKGFIPWDDDIDIAMKREDYRRFAEIVEQELPKGWVFRSIYSNNIDGWDVTFSGVINSDYISTAPEHLAKNHGCPYVVGVDIFPLDYLAPGEEAEVVYLLLQYIVAVEWVIKKGKEEEAAEFIMGIEEMCRVRLKRDDTILSQLIELRDTVMGLYKEEEAEELISVSFKQDKESVPRYKKEWFQEIIRMPFESIEVPVPKCYDEILRVSFGEDYMTPVRDMSGHDYPFYKNQKQQIQDRIREIMKEREEEV